MTTLRLTDSLFLINDHQVQFPLDPDSLNDILQALCRSVKKKHNTIFTWDNQGILGYSKDGKTIDRLLLEYNDRDFDFSPNRPFTGTFLYQNEDIVSYYEANKHERVQLFAGDSTGGLVLDGISVWFDIKNKQLDGIEIGAFEAVENPRIPADKYLIKPPNEPVIEFTDFGFKLAVVQELMYEKGLLQPEFDLFEFVLWYPKRDIDLEKEGYDPIPEVTQYFKDLPIPKRLAREVTEIYQDGGNDIYLQLLRFAEGWEEYLDIETAADARQFPNLRKMVLCYAKPTVMDELTQMGIAAKWL
jgi:hypothetical protein